MKTKEMIDALCTLGRKKTDPVLAMGSLLYYGSILLNRYSIQKDINSLPNRIQFYCMMFAPSGVGKALSNSEDVLTPSGFVKNGTLSVGDKVIGSNGKAVSITHIHKQGIRKIYKVSFRDGSYLMCDKNHLFTVRPRFNKNLITLSVEDMLKNGLYKMRLDKRYNKEHKEFQYAVPFNTECHYGSDDNLPIDPYLLGLLLGDGCFRLTSGVDLVNKNKKIIDDAIALLPKGTISSRVRYERGAYRVNFINKNRSSRSKLRLELEKLGLIGHKSTSKFIPDIYKNGSLKTRKEIVRGLIDTDGHILNGKLNEYSTSSKQLAKDFLELGRSIGMRLNCRSRIPKYKYKGEIKYGKLSYRIVELSRSDFNPIHSIEYSHDEEATCITIDSDDSLYIAGKGFTVTHNSYLSGKVQEICALETYPEQMKIMYNHFISLEPDTVADEDIEKFIPASPTVSMSGSKEGLYQICRAVKDSGFGSVNLQVDEFADTVTGSQELINKLKELYDGKYQAKVIKGVKGEAVEHDINNITANMLAIGSLDGLDSTARKVLNTLAKSGMYRRSLVINSTAEIEKNDLKDADMEQIKKHFAKLDKKWKESYKKRLEKYTQIGSMHKTFMISSDAKEYIEKIDSMLLKRHQEDKLNLFKSYDIGSLNLIVNIGYIFAFLEGKDRVDIEHLKQAWSLFITTRESTYEIFKEKQPHIEIYELLKMKPNLTQSELLNYDRADCIPSSKTKFKDTMLLVQELAYKRGEELYIGTGVVTRYSIRSLPLTNLDKLIFSIEKDWRKEKSIVYEAIELEWSNIEKLAKSNKREVIDNETGEIEIVGVESFTVAHYNSSAKTDPYGHRKKDNFIQGQNVIGFDIDNGMKIEEIKIILEPYTYCLYTTKSHGKVKRDYGHSFRILIPTKNMFYVNPEQHKQMYKNIVEFLRISPDIACYNVSRLYFTNANAEVFINEASLFDVSPFMPDTDMNEKLLPLLLRNKIGANSIKSESDKSDELERRIEGMVNHSIIYIQKGTLRDGLYKLWKFIIDITGGDKIRAEKELRFVQSAKGFPERFIEEILSNHG